MTDLSFYNKKRVLITGHTGFKGSWLCQILLGHGANLCGIGLKPNTDPNMFELLKLDNKIENHYLDIRDFDSVKSVFDSFMPEIVLHLAAQPIVIESYKEPRYTYDVNVMGTVNICECIRLSDSVKSFVNITTDKVYENNDEDNHYFKEDEKLNGYDPYSNSKSCSDIITQSYAKSFLSEKGVAVSTCRAGNVIGGGDFSINRIIPDCVRATISNETIKVRNPNSFRPYQHVLEADVFYLLLAMRQFEDICLSGQYNIGPNDDDCISTLELVRLFAENWAGSGFECVSVDNPHEADYLKLDSSKAKNMLNWKPKWSVSQAVKKTTEWYKAYSFNQDLNQITNLQIGEYIRE